MSERKKLFYSRIDVSKAPAFSSEENNADESDRQVLDMVVDQVSRLGH